jgi:hypothetical protein
MNKKLLLVALTCTVLAFTGNLFAQDPSSLCTNGATVQAIVVGSSAQFDTMAYAAQDVITKLGTTPFNLFSSKGLSGSGSSEAYVSAIEDIRPTANNALDSATLWVIYDTPSGSNPCNVWAYYSVDSTVGNRAFFASVHTTVSTKTYSGAGVWPCLAGMSAAPCSNPLTVGLDQANWCTGACTFSKQTSQVGGVPDQYNVSGVNYTATAATDFLPTSVYTAITNTAALAQNSGGTAKPSAYCGQLGAASATTNFFCYFSAAATDIRPEDAYYATARLIKNAVATGMTGLDYNNSNCKVGSDTTCQIYDSFGQHGTFNALLFNITAKDPYDTLASVPGYTTLSVGAAPVLVEVSENGAGTSVAFNKTYTDTNGNTVYLFNNINRNQLATIFSGNSYCTGDILPAAPLACEAVNPQPGCGFGSGPALQVVHREPLSGTYNTFEFTGIRSMGGSNNAAISHESATGWTSNDDGGQEMFMSATSTEVTNSAVYPYFIDPGASGMGWSGGSLASACGGPISTLGLINVAGIPSGTQNCSDPLFISGANLPRVPNCASGNYLRMRAIGTGQEVPDVMGLNNSGAAQVKDGIGYTFWSYGNVSKAWSSGNPIAHYLTVDHIDPLFATAGGYYDRTDLGGAVIPNTFPNCDGGTSTTITKPCTNYIPFTHLYDGSYPLFSVLRVVTFAVKTNASEVPIGIQNLIALDQQEAAPVAQGGSNTADFVPFLTNLVNSGTITAPSWKGDLNLGIYRVHFKEGTGAAAVNPGNGHEQCAGSFTGVALQGGTAAHSACLVDTGSDVGGAVETVQSDADFAVDFDSQTVEGVALSATYEQYGQRQ